jgi:hypothetical protein
VHICVRVHVQQGRCKLKRLGHPAALAWPAVMARALLPLQLLSVQQSFAVARRANDDHLSLLHCVTLQVMLVWEERPRRVLMLLKVGYILSRFVIL